MPCGKTKALREWRKRYAKERREHPWASAAVVRRIIRDHSKKKK